MSYPQYNPPQRHYESIKLILQSASTSNRSDDIYTIHKTSCFSQQTVQPYHHIIHCINSHSQYQSARAASSNGSASLPSGAVLSSMVCCCWARFSCLLTRAVRPSTHVGRHKALTHLASHADGRLNCSALSPAAAHRVNALRLQHSPLHAHTIFKVHRLPVEGAECSVPQQCAAAVGPAGRGVPRQARSPALRFGRGSSIADDSQQQQRRRHRPHHRRPPHRCWPAILQHYLQLIAPEADVARGSELPCSRLESSCLSDARPRLLTLMSTGMVSSRIFSISIRLR